MKNDILTVLVIFIVIGALALPSIINAFAEAFERLGEWIKYGWDWQRDGHQDGSSDGTLPVIGSEGTNASALGLEIIYTDGSSQLFKPDLEDTSFSLLPLKIMDGSGATVSAVKVHFYAVITYRGGILAWSAEGNIKVTGLYTTTGSILGELDSFTISNTGSGWENGTEKLIGTYELSASTIESWLGGDGTYVLTFDLSASVSVQFPDYSWSETLTGTSSTSWTCIRDTTPPPSNYALTSLEVSIRTSTLH